MAVKRCILLHVFLIYAYFWNEEIKIPFKFSYFFPNCYLPEGEAKGQLLLFFACWNAFTDGDCLQNLTDNTLVPHYYGTQANIKSCVYYILLHSSIFKFAVKRYFINVLKL